MMMKYNLLLFLFIICFGANAQLIHVDGSKTVGLSFGYVKNGFNISSQLSLYQKNSLAYRASIDYERIKVNLTNANIFSANPTLMYTFYSSGEKLFLNAKGGVILGTEFLSNKILNRKTSQFFVGENLGFSLEYFINEKFMINLDFDQRFLQLSRIGSTSFISKIGININF